MALDVDDISLKRFVEEIINLSRRGFLKEENILAMDFLRCALIDLEASKLLSERDVYAPAVYHLQQSVEKGAKSCMLWLGIIDIKTARKQIKHETPLAFVKLLEFPPAKGLIQAISQKKSNELEDAILNARDIVKNKTGTFATLSYDQIKELLVAIREVENQTQSLLDGIYNELMEKGISHDANLNWFPSVSAPLKLFILGIVTFKHEGLSRYPEGIVKPWQYTSELGIVKALPEIFPVLETSLKQLQSSLA